MRGLIIGGSHHLCHSSFKHCILNCIQMVVKNFFIVAESRWDPGPDEFHVFHRITRGNRPSDDRHCGEMRVKAKNWLRRNMLLLKGIRGWRVGRCGIRRIQPCHEWGKIKVRNEIVMIVIIDRRAVEMAELLVMMVVGEVGVVIYGCELTQCMLF